jgi:hypothetical protein
MFLEYGFFGENIWLKKIIELPQTFHPLAPAAKIE